MIQKIDENQFIIPLKTTAIQKELISQRKRETSKSSLV